MKVADGYYDIDRCVNMWDRIKAAARRTLTENMKRQPTTGSATTPEVSCVT